MPPIKRATRGPGPSNIYMRKSTKGALKKTTAKGAYRPARKKQINKRMRPMVETKKRIQSVIAVGTAPYGIPNQLTIDQMQIGPTHPNYVVNLPWSFLSQNQGVGNDTMLGSNIYSRFLKQKYEFTFGQETSHTPGYGNPCEYFLIHGWCTVPLNRSQFTDPSLATFDRSKMTAHVDEQVRQYFDNENDMLSFDSKFRSGIKIISKRAIKQNVRPLTLARQVVVSGYEGGNINLQGGIAPIYMSCSWPTKRKIHYTPGATDTGDPLDTSFFYPNWSWIPFSLIYSPNAKEGNTTSGIKFQTDNAHYYSDS